MLLADSTWLVYSIWTKQWALMIQSLVLMVFALQGIDNWKKRGIDL